jgi:predicted nucleic-acid-binding Zn-ribbon protein
LAKNGGALPFGRLSAKGLVIHAIQRCGNSPGGMPVKNGKCPKCGSKEVYCGDDVHPKSGPFGSNSIPVSLTSIASLDNYVCTDCGYMESYIADPAKLKEIFVKWRRVS